MRNTGSMREYQGTCVLYRGLGGSVGGDSPGLVAEVAMVTVFMAFLFLNSKSSMASMMLGPFFPFPKSTCMPSSHSGGEDGGISHQGLL